jgi:hypothetical protein
MLTLRQRQERAARRAARTCLSGRQVAATHEAIRAAAGQDTEGRTIMKKSTKVVAATKATTAPTSAHGAAGKPPVAKDAKPPKAVKGAKPATKRPKKPSLLNLAAEVLAKAGNPMGCKEIVEAVLAKGEWKTKGKTPAATLYSAIIREIAKLGQKARFRKVDRGQFEAVAAKK